LVDEFHKEYNETVEKHIFGNLPKPLCLFGVQVKWL